MAVDVIVAGTLATVTATFNAEGTGEPTDPSTVTLKFSQGAGKYPSTTWVYQGVGSITRSGTGVYVAELDTTDQPGTWTVVWFGTGAVQVVQDAQFPVKANPLP